MTVFLRGARVDLLAPDAADPGFAATRRAWLLPPAQPEPDVEADGEVALAWAPPHGPTGGSVALAAIDWRARRAQLVAYLAPGAPREDAREALAMAARYARDELALERLEARVRADDAATRADLAALGFAEEGRLAGAWRDELPVDVVLLARWARVEPG